MPYFFIHLNFFHEDLMSVSSFIEDFIRRPIIVFFFSEQSIILQINFHFLLDKNKRDFFRLIHLNLKF